jgi:hypothetical protein
MTGQSVSRSHATADPDARPPLADAGVGATFVFNFPNYHGDERQPMDLMRKAALVFEKRNARPALGS